MYSLYRPVYLKGRNTPLCPQCQQNQSPIPKKPSPSPPKSPPQLPEPPPPTGGDENPIDDEDSDLHIPVLICRRGVTMVWPHEATRAVLMGKIPYYYADEKGCTRYEPKHIFHALRLCRKDRDKYGEYPLVGGHQRFLPKKEKRRFYQRIIRPWRDYGEIYNVSSSGRFGCWY